MLAVVRTRLGLAAALVAFAPLSISTKVAADDTESARVVLVQTASVDEGSFGSALVALLAPQANVRIVRGEPAAGGDAAVRAWALKTARAEKADATLWLEAGSSPGEVTLWVVDVRGDLPRVESIAVSEPNLFDRDRTLALAAQSLLRLASESAIEDEAQHPARTPATAAPDAAAPPPGLEPPPPDPTPEADLEDQGGNGATPHSTLHAAVGPVLRASSGTAFGWRTALGLRSARHLLFGVGFDLLLEERLDSAFSRTRIPVFATFGFAIPVGSAVLGASPSVGVVFVSATRSADESANAATNALAGTAGVQLTAALPLWEELFACVVVSGDVRLLNPPVDLMLGADQAIPRFELAVSIQMGFGAP
jgi:hypothetical protein